MDIFLSLFTSILPLYVIIALGWIAGRFYDVDKNSLANLAIYMLVPAVTFYYMAGIKFDVEYFSLPFIAYFCYSAMTLIAYKLGLSLYDDKRANLLAMCSGTKNNGYMGLPVIILFFPPEWVGVYVFTLVGSLMYEATVMYYVANRGNFSPMESLKRVFKFPVIYAAFFGLVFNLSGLEIPQQTEAFWGYFRGAYVVIGMMIIGVSLSRVSKLVMSAKFLSAVFAAQFIIWPLLTFGLVWIDQTYLYLFAEEVHKFFIIMALLPPAANVAAFAAALNLNAEKAATTILLGTVFALFYIPTILVLSGLY
ncbi:MAG: AEC family transporter [Pseudomonadota bacterium]